MGVCCALLEPTATPTETLVPTLTPAEPVLIFESPTPIDVIPNPPTLIPVEVPVELPTDAPIESSADPVIPVATQAPS